MEAAEPTDMNREPRNPKVSISVNSPDNRIAARDYIEINIHVGAANQSSASQEDEGREPSEGADRCVEIQEIVSHTISTLFPKGILASGLVSSPLAAAGD